MLSFYVVSIQSIIPQVDESVAPNITPLSKRATFIVVAELRVDSVFEVARLSAGTNARCYCQSHFYRPSTHSRGSRF